jgi:hypothetical protein
MEITASTAALVDHCCKNSKETAATIIRDQLGISQKEAESLVWSWEQGLMKKELPKKKSRKGMKAIIDKLFHYGIEVHKENMNISIPYGKPLDPNLKEDMQTMISFGFTVTEQPYISQPKSLF